MKKILIIMTFTLLGFQAFAQDDVDPKVATKKAQEDVWAATAKAKVADEAAVAAQRTAESAKKVLPETKLEIHIYDGKGGKTISK